MWNQESSTGVITRQPALSQILLHLQSKQVPANTERDGHHKHRDGQHAKRWGKSPSKSGVRLTPGNLSTLWTTEERCINQGKECLRGWDEFLVPLTAMQILIDSWKDWETCAVIFSHNEWYVSFYMERYSDKKHKTVTYHPIYFFRAQQTFKNFSQIGRTKMAA